MKKLKIFNCLGHQPLISVLMTAYNRDRYIGEAIESVTASTYENWELIIVDDGSKDSTVAIAKSYAAKDERIKVYVNEKNLGDYPNRNRAASYAKGKYLKFVDSDDRIYPDALHTMIMAMESSPGAEWGLGIFHNTFEIDHSLYLDAESSYRYHYFTKPIFFASPGESIFTLKAFNKVGGFAPERMVGDFDMWHKLALNFPMVLIPGKLIWIRTHGEQEIADRDKYAIKYEKVKLKYLTDARSSLTRSEVSDIRKRRRNTVLKIFVKKMAKGDLRAALPRLKVFCFYLIH